jgi:glycosyltransferase involved in cell wall biosynthesis
MPSGDCLVTCVIPTHRRPQLLARALESALAQTLAPGEVIVVDDEASDAARAVASAAAESARCPVRYLTHSRGRGPSTSRNVGAESARGEWLAFLDDDDAWLPGYLAAALANASADLILTARWDVAEDGVRRPGKAPPSSFEERDWLRRNLGGTGSSTIIRRALFSAIGGYDEKLRASEDRDLILRAMRAGARYAAVGERLLEHRDQGPRLTRRARAILPGRLRFLAKHFRFMSAGDVGNLLRKTIREVRRAAQDRS